MKRIATIGMILILTFTGLISNAKPVYIGVRIGFPAKWAVVLGECESAWGICLSFPMAPVPGQFAGYDPETDKIFVKIMKNDPLVRNGFVNPLVIKEDSQLEPKLVSQFSNLKQKTRSVFIKAGTYKVYEEGDSFVVQLDYYVK